MSKRPIPQVPSGPPARVRFDSALKENIEALTGARLGRLPPATNRGERWQDLLSEITTRTTPGPGTPVFNVFRAPVRAYQFVVGNEVYNTFHIPHDWKIGTSLYVHVHWAGDNADTGTVTWDLNWTYARGYGQQAFPACSSLQVTQAHCGVAYGHNIAEMSDAQAFVPDGCETDGLLMVATKLSAQAYTGNVFGFYIDLHYQSDELLTTTRNPLNGTWFKNDTENVGETINNLNSIIERLQ